MAIDNTVTSMGSAAVRSLEETRQLAARLLPLAKRFGCVSLEGPLGAGKTHFVKATALELGITEAVSSPTFTLLHSYRCGTSILHHSDWYRLESPREAEALCLEEYLGEGLLMIEWGDKFPELLPPGTLRISIKPVEEEDGRADDRIISWKPSTP
jgi:tRNA threonylcarbamoyladenosine biosynthesis protein TsaE